MYDPFDRRLLAAASVRYDARLRHQIDVNNRPRDIRVFRACTYVSHGVHTQRGGPSPQPLPSTPRVRFATSNRGSSVSARARYAAAMRRRTPRTH